MKNPCKDCACDDCDFPCKDRIKYLRWLEKQEKKNKRIEIIPQGKFEMNLLKILKKGEVSYGK